MSLEIVPFGNSLPTVGYSGTVDTLGPEAGDMVAVADGGGGNAVTLATEGVHLIIGVTDCRYRIYTGAQPDLTKGLRLPAGAIHTRVIPAGYKLACVAL